MIVAVGITNFKLIKKSVNTWVVKARIEVIICVG